LNAQGSKAHVVIVGGGFAGLACAHALAKTNDVRITLIDKNNYHQFQPLLYQLATAAIGTDDIATSLRHSLRRYANVDVKMAEVTAADPKTRTVTTGDGTSYQGDFLVLAAGSQANFFGTAGAKENAFPLYSIQEAQQLRSRILTVFEESDREPKRAEQGALNFVIVGGGPTGVEMAGSLADLIRLTMTREYTDLAVKYAQVYLIDHGHALLGAFSEEAHDYASRVLLKKGVKLRLGIGVKEVAPDHVLLSDGTSIQTRTVIWGGGLSASPLSASAGLPRGHGGRIDVRPDLTVDGFPGVYVLGDFANIPSPEDESLPQLGSVAQQSGAWAAKNILAEIAGDTRTAFHYHDKGIMAMIGRNAAVAAIGKKRHELDGAIGFAAWIGVHALLMSGVRERVEAFVDWGWNYFSKSRAIQILDRADVSHIDWDKETESEDLPSTSVESAR
jgi:NADH:ubiquinone reductase (H+-translocating)